jgi:hypothetical protein
MLSQQAILEYQQLYKKEFGVELPLSSAADQSCRLVELLLAVLSPKLAIGRTYEKYRQKIILERNK